MKKVLIIDIEQTCWEDKTEQQPEIIEVGVVEVDVLSKKITRTRQIYVKPEKTTISEYCTELTGITPSIVKKQGVDYDTMVKIMLNKFGSKNKLVIGWGRDDLGFKKENTPINDYMNFSALYSMQKGVDKKFNLTEALENENLSFEGNLHSGLDDAINTANLFIKTVLK